MEINYPFSKLFIVKICLWVPFSKYWVREWVVAICLSLPDKKLNFSFVCTLSVFMLEWNQNDTLGD